MKDPWTDRLSEYVDGDLPTAEREALEGHLSGCPECRLVVADLREVRRRAENLADRAPAKDLWPGIAARIQRRAGGPVPAEDGTVDLPARRLRRPARRLSLTVPQLAAAGVATLLLGAGAVRLVERADAGDPEPVLVEAPAAAGAADDVRLARSATYETAIRQLELQLDAGREQLDPATVRTIETSLATIDRAIAQARRALERDPANAYLNQHLSRALSRKVELLRQATALAGT